MDSDKVKTFSSHVPKKPKNKQTPKHRKLHFIGSHLSFCACKLEGHVQSTMLCKCDARTGLHRGPFCPLVYLRRMSPYSKETPIMGNLHTGCCHSTRSRAILDWSAGSNCGIWLLLPLLFRVPLFSKTAAILSLN